MAKTRYTGKSGTIAVDVLGGVSYTQVTVARNIQLPAHSKTRIDVTGMEDDDAETRPGIGEESEFSFEIQWDPNETIDAALRTALDDDTYCTFRAQFTDGTTTLTVTWAGYIVALNPVGVDGSSPVAMQVVGVRTGAITEAVA